MLPLKDKVAIVTGAASGIGRAAALRFANQGADIALIDICDEDAALVTLQQIVRTGRHVRFIRADVSDSQAMQSAIQAVAEQFGHIDILVNNAAVSVRKSFLETSLEEARRTLDVTQWGAYISSYLVAQHMARQASGGNIVMISSVHAERPYPNAAAYNTAKAGLNHLAQSLAVELAPHNIRVNTIEPGWIDTPGERRHYTEREINERAKTLPLQRLGTAEEIANAIAFLCSDQAPYITGATLRVDGAFALRF